MKAVRILSGTVLAVSLFASACNNASEKAEESKNTTPVITEKPVTTTLDTVTMNGYVVYDSASTEKRPVVLIVPEWWGVNDYVRSRARQLAELGYVAMVVDMYGNGRTADNPKTALEYAMPFYKDPVMAKARLDAAMNTALQLPQADTANVAAIGYCFGGSMVLNSAKLGGNYKAVVSFHGGLEGVPADKDKLKAKILVCHGNADPYVPQAQVDNFRKQLDSINADYTFKGYDSATHAFTNPQATETGRKFDIPVAYNEAADKKSWEDMREFLRRTLGR